MDLEEQQMLHSPPVWRERLKRRSDQIEEKKNPCRWTYRFGTAIQFEIITAILIVRLLNEHDMLPNGLAKKEVPLRSYRRVADEWEIEAFHRAHDLGRPREWHLPFIRLLSLAHAS